MEEKSVVTMTYSTPCGDLLLGTNSGALIQADWVDGWHEATVRARLNRYLGDPAFVSGTDPVLVETASQLDDYFAGKRQTFDLPLRFLGTEFQTAVWDALRKIPFGRVTTYGEIAEAIGKPKAMRAVGIAVGENPSCRVTAWWGGMAASRGTAAGSRRSAIFLILKGSGSRPPCSRSSGSDPP